MQRIYIPHLTKDPSKTRTIEVHDYLSGLETLTPVKGRIQVQHRGNFLEVSAQAEAIITLNCHRCLQNYNARVQVDTSEFIWLQDPQPEEYAEEVEVSFDDLVETLPPQGHFEPAKWLYEQFCLAIPQRQLCDQTCEGIANPLTSDETSTETDQRWAALSALKQQLSD
ncbi:metal-binding possibly nucleic-acid binding protein [Leptolyngbya sp. Heron Island J]|uniref:YceD family protein n=1 Tax=Leptolyngbya sp. Heron Island J TaxID=1385935 RepID=UPI0003B97529|nr:YceD family protein [Leptolyngbya sp. Heron Island J]ESA37575.1 metal-binding possibly nucleic-acid binding protein [Leptolyngbya sp. Heron Island J]